MSDIEFYCENMCGDTGHFFLSREEVPKAIMSAWNIEASLDVITENKEHKLIFDPGESNECNNNWLEEYGLYIKDGVKYRELHYIKDDSLAWGPDNYDDILDLALGGYA